MTQQEIVFCLVTSIKSRFSQLAITSKTSLLLLQVNMQPCVCHLVTILIMPIGSCGDKCGFWSQITFMWILFYHVFIVQSWESYILPSLSLKFLIWRQGNKSSSSTGLSLGSLRYFTLPAEHNAWHSVSACSRSALNDCCCFSYHLIS